MTALCRFLAPGERTVEGDEVVIVHNGIGLNWAPVSFDVVTARLARGVRVRHRTSLNVCRRCGRSRP